MINEETGLSFVTVDEMIKLLSESYISLIEHNTPFVKFPSVMLWGPPGVGKSQGVRAIAKKIEERAYKKAVITDVRLLLFNPVDLRGIPTANEDKTLAVWLKPKIFQMDDSEDIVNILFLDEISAAPPSVQSAAYQITLDRTVGEHKLPDNCIVIAAGNRVTDHSVAYNMPKALANRLCHFDIKADYQSWHDWAVRNDIHPFVLGYIDYNTVALARSDISGTALAFPTPRSWEMVSNILNEVSENIENVYPMIVGCIGYNTASNFRTWSKLYDNMPDLKDIFSSRIKDIPKAEELLTVLRSAMVRYARDHISEKGINNSIEYACKLPWSFRKKLLHDYSLIPEIREIILDNEVYKSAVKDGLK